MNTILQFDHQFLKGDNLNTKAFASHDRKICSLGSLFKAYHINPIKCSGALNFMKGGVI